MMASLAAAVYSRDQASEDLPASVINKKYYNWLRRVFRDPPYLLDLYKLFTEEARREARVARPVSPPRPPSPPPEQLRPSSSSSWIYFPKGDGDHGASSLSEWLAQGGGSVGGGDGGGEAMTSQGCSNHTLWESLRGNLTDALKALASNSNNTSNNNSNSSCALQWMVDLAKNGTAPNGDAGKLDGGSGVRGAAAGGATFAKDPWAWPDDYFYGRNFTFYDYDYDANGWPESRLEQIYKIIRAAQWNSNIVLTVFLAVIFVLGIAGNLLVLAVFTRSRVRQASAVFIMALAGTDLIICGAVLPGVLLKEWAVPFRNDAVCKLWEWLRCTTIPLSSLILVAVAVDRYVLIARAALTKPLSNRYAKGIILLAFLASAGIAVLPSLGVGVYQRSGTGSSSSSSDGDEEHSHATSLPTSHSFQPTLSIDTSLSSQTASSYSSATTTASPFITSPHHSAPPNATSIISPGILPHQTSVSLNLLYPPASAAGHGGILNYALPTFTTRTSSQPAGSSMPTSKAQSTESNPNQPPATMLSRDPHHALSATTSPLAKSPSSFSMISPSSLPFPTTSVLYPASNEASSSTVSSTTISTPQSPMQNPSVDFYLGLCWQNGLLVSEVSTEHYWWAVAVLFLVVLLLVLVLYGLVFRAVLQQSQRWGRVSDGTQPVAGSSSPAASTSRDSDEKQARMGTASTIAHSFRGNGNLLEAAVLSSHTGQPNGQAYPRLHSSKTAMCGARPVGPQCTHKDINNSSLSQICGSPGTSGTASDQDQNKMAITNTSLTELGSDLSQKPRKLNKDSFESSGEDKGCSPTVTKLEPTAKEFLYHNEEAFKLENQMQGECGKAKRKTHCKKKHVNKTYESKTPRVFICGTRTDDDDNDIDGYVDDDVTSLDDGHYNNLTDHTNTTPGANSLPGQVVLHATSFFCTGACVVGRTKHYQSFLHDAYDLKQQQRSNWDMEAESSAPGPLTKTTCLPCGTETSYKRPGWLKRQVVRALQHTSTYHQQKRKVHQNAVIKLTRRQRAKVRMLEEEQRTWAYVDHDHVKSTPVAAWAVPAGGEAKESSSMCNHLDMDSKTESQENSEENSKLVCLSRSQPDENTIPDNIVHDTGRQHHLEVTTERALIPSTGRHLQKEIGCLANTDLSPNTPLTQEIVSSAGDQGMPTEKPDTCNNSDKVGQCYNDAAYYQEGKEAASYLKSGDYHILSPYGTGSERTELNGHTFLLPNAPLSDFKHEERLKNLTGQRDASDRQPPHCIVKRILQNQEQREANSDDKANQAVFNQPKQQEGSAVQSELDPQNSCDHDRQSKNWPCSTYSQSLMPKRLGNQHTTFVSKNTQQCACLNTDNPQMLAIHMNELKTTNAMKHKKPATICLTEKRDIKLPQQSYTGTSEVVNLHHTRRYGPNSFLHSTQQLSPPGQEDICPHQHQHLQGYKQQAPQGYKQQAPQDDSGNPDRVKPGVQRKRYSTAQVKTAKVLLLVTAVYLVSFAPALLMTLNLVPSHRIIFYAYFVHSAANPLIYSFINQAFRKQLAGLFKGKRHGRR